MLYRQGIALAVASAMALGGCTTMGFAPPEVSTRQHGGAVADAECDVTTTEVNRDVSGATALTENFLTAYRCAARQAANGRQLFEVPSFLALVAAAAGPTFGMKKRGVVASGLAAGVFGQANSYFAPREKAAILDHAIDALVCIKAEAVGVSFYDTTAPAPGAALALAAGGDPQIAEIDSSVASLTSDVALLTTAMNKAQPGAVRDQFEQRIQRINDLIAQLNERRAELVVAASRNVNNIRVTRGGVTINVSEQYFETVSSALLSVERILAQRLSNAGRAFDAAGISAEIEKATRESGAAQDEMNTLLQQQAGQVGRALALNEARITSDDIAVIDVKALQPKLQACVVRAKM